MSYKYLHSRLSTGLILIVASVTVVVGNVSVIAKLIMYEQFGLVISIHILDLFVASQISDASAEDMEEGKFIQLLVITFYCSVMFQLY